MSHFLFRCPSRFAVIRQSLLASVERAATSLEMIHLVHMHNNQTLRRRSR